jgi:hypothetical protein
MQFCVIDGTPLSTLYDPEETLPLKNRDIANESQIKFPIEIFRVYCLFGYETDGGRESALWNDPMSFHRLARERDDAFSKYYDSWKQSKRKFSRDEVLAGTWVKVADKGQQHRLELHGNGTLTERARFNDNDYWAGKWKLIDGILRLNINIYELDIVASKDGLHSGIEDEGDHRNAYFIVFHGK